MITEGDTIVSSYESTTTRLARQELGACALVEDLLPLYIEGEVSPGSRDIIVEHLARCERCAGFLAGAQSVRAQLRRETTQRASVALQNQPEQRAVAKGQWILFTLAVLFCCGIGAAGSAGVWVGIDHREVLPLSGGALLTAIAFGLLLALARSRTQLTITRVLALLGGCAAGAASTFLMIVPHDGKAALCGMLFGIVGIVGVWLSIWQGGAQPADVANELQSQHTRLAVGGVLVGFTFVVLGAISINTLFWSPSIALVMVDQVFRPQPLYRVEFWSSSVALTLIGIILMLAGLRGSRKR